MKVFIFIVCIVFCQLKSSFAQENKNYLPSHHAILNFKTDPVMWPEFGYIYLGKRFQSFQIKGSIRNNYEFNEYPTFYTGRIQSIVFKSSYYYIKPGYLLAHKVKEKRKFLLFVNYLYAHGENTIRIEYEDPLLGNTKEIYSQTNNFHAIECEFNWQINLGKRFGISTGFILGSKLGQDPIIFEHVYNSAFSGRDVYTPGVGYFKGGYILLNLGIAAKIN